MLCLDNQRALHTATLSMSRRLGVATSSSTALASSASRFAALTKRPLYLGSRAAPDLLSFRSGALPRAS